MYKFLFILLLSTFLYSSQDIIAIFASIKKQERAVVVTHFKQEKALRFNLRSKPYFHRGKSKKQGNFQYKNRLSGQGKRN